MATGLMELFVGTTSAPPLWDRPYMPVTVPVFSAIVPDDQAHIPSNKTRISSKLGYPML